MRSEGGPTGRQSERKNGGSEGTGPVLCFSLPNGSKGPTEGEFNEANFDNGSFTLDGMRYSEWSPGGRPGAKGAWLGDVQQGIVTVYSLAGFLPEPE